MTDTAAVPVTSRPTEERYATRTISYAGHEYTFSVYKGFASLVEFTPPGTDQPIEVYRQNGVFNCQDTGGPLPNSTLTITGGPLELDVELAIDDTPAKPGELGPIDTIEVGLKRRGTPVTPAPRVRPIRGGDQVSRILVRERPQNGKGGVKAFQTDGGGTVVVTNTATTCPPDC